MRNKTWKYEDALYQSTEPIYVASLSDSFNIGFDVGEQFLNQPQPHQEKTLRDHQELNIVFTFQ